MNFRSSCQTPQLVRLVAKCVISILVSVMVTNAYLIIDMNHIDKESLYMIEDLLAQLFTEYPFPAYQPLIITSVGQEIIHRCKKNLSDMRILINMYTQFSDHVVLKKMIADLYFYTS